MATNIITIEFLPCQPTPSAGYRVLYRPVGTGGAYRVADGFTESPAVIVDEQDESGTEYEGVIQGDCGGVYGVGEPFATGAASPSGSASEPSSPEPELRIVNNTNATSITGIYTTPQGGGVDDARLVTCDAGYPLPAGQQSNGSVHPDHLDLVDYDVTVYFSAAVFADTRVHVTDSASATGCAAGTFVALIGVLGPFTFNNVTGWQIKADHVPC